MINFVRNMLYTLLSWGIMLGLLPINCKDKEQQKATETPEVSATPENPPKRKTDDEMHENDDDFELEEEESEWEEVPQPKRRKERDGDGPDA